MKKILIIAILLTGTMAGCKKVKTISYAGVFKLNKQIISNGRWDTTWIKEQAKIYTDRYYIYSGLSADSSVRFGFGTYELEAGNTVAEHNIFNSKALDSAQIFVVHVKQTHKGFTGTVPEWARSGSSVYKLTEDYSKVALSPASELDGVWELNKIYWVKGKDTIRQHRNQFKVFWRGHFMFIHRYPVDPVGAQLKNGFGYGKFALKGNKLMETEEMSSHAELINRNFLLKVTIKADEYTQVLNDPKTNMQTTEIYKRIKSS